MDAARSLHYTWTGTTTFVIEDQMDDDSDVLVESLATLMHRQNRMNPKMNLLRLMVMDNLKEEAVAKET